MPGVIRAALKRVIGFELQFGPFAVAQLRLMAEVADLLRVKGTVPEDVRLRPLHHRHAPATPYAEEEYIPQMLKPLAESRRQANAVKRQEPITVVIGNPPYKEKARGRGGWIEAGSANAAAPLARWQPPADWGVGAHTKHLRNLYVYFWRWATWKVFGDAAGAPQAGDRRGVVCFITVAGFLNGPGFQAMRDDLRQQHGRDLRHRLLARGASAGGRKPGCSRACSSRSASCWPCAAARRIPRSRRGSATTRCPSPAGRRSSRRSPLLSLDDAGWTDCPAGGRRGVPAVGDRVAGRRIRLSTRCSPTTDRAFMPGRTWVIAPDQVGRWQTVGSGW